MRRRTYHTALVGGHRSVGHSKAEGADVVGDDLHGDAMLAAVFFARQLGDAADELAERYRSRSCSRPAVRNCTSAQTHAGIHVFFRQWLQGSRIVAVILDEDQVPYFNQITRVVYEHTALLRRQIVAWVVMDFRAGAAGAGHAHSQKFSLAGRRTTRPGSKSVQFIPERLGLHVGFYRVVAHKGRWPRAAPFPRAKVLGKLTPNPTRWPLF